jgi:hypothetical protein
MAVISAPRPQLVAEIAKACGAVLMEGTATGGTTTTLIDTARLLYPTDDMVKGAWLYIWQGTAIGQDREITAFTASSDTVTFATGTAPDTTSKYILLKPGWTPNEIIDAINAAIRAVSLTFLLPKSDESLVLNTLLSNGHFQTWSSSSACTNWTSSGTLAKESSIIRSGLYSLKVTKAGATSVTQSVGDFARYAGKTFTLRAYAYTATASELTLRLTDGVTTWNSSAHDTIGWGGNAGKYLEVTGTVGNAPTALTASMQSATGAACYLERLTLAIPAIGDADDYIYEYTIPSGFATLHGVYLEDPEGSGVCHLKVPGHMWSIFTDAAGTRKLKFNRNLFHYTDNRVIRLEGLKYPTEMTDNTTASEIDASYIVNYAVARLLSSRMAGDKIKYGLWQETKREAMIQAERMMKTLPPDSQQVENM